MNPPFLPPADRAERQLQVLDELILIGLQLARLLPAQAAREAELRDAAAPEPELMPHEPAAPEPAPAASQPLNTPPTEIAAPRAPAARHYAWPSAALCYARIQQAMAKAIQLQRAIQAERDKAAHDHYYARNGRRNDIAKNPALRDRYRIFHTLEQEIAAHAPAGTLQHRFLLEDLDDAMQHEEFGGKLGTHTPADIAAAIRRALGLPQPGPDPPA
jgi:hypothetical protein